MRLNQFFLIMGSKTQTQTLRNKIKRKPLMCGNFETKEKLVEKWLGQYLSSDGLGDSVEQTVMAREGRVRGAALEIATLINDWRARVSGGLDTAIMLWEQCYVPALLHGAGSWVEMAAKTTKRMNNLQRWFLRLVLQVGPGAPLASLTWETGVMDMGLRVALEKIKLVLHIRSLSENTLAKKVYTEQRKNGWPGLAKESKSICEDLNIGDVSTTTLSNKEFIKEAKSAMKKKDEDNLKALSENKTKMEKVLKEPFGMTNY